MSLQEKLDALKKKSESSLSREALETMHRATEDLSTSGILDRVVREGDKAPDFTLKNAYREPVHLMERLARGPVVLGFYRGRW